jgi:hypothetical protein
MPNNGDELGLLSVQHLDYPTVSAPSTRPNDPTRSSGRWDNAPMTSPDATLASVHVLGAVYRVTSEGMNVDVLSASQRRLLGLLAIHAPRQLRAEWLAEVLGVTASRSAMPAPMPRLAPVTRARRPAKRVRSNWVMAVS